MWRICTCGSTVWKYDGDMTEANQGWTAAMASRWRCRSASAIESELLSAMESLTTPAAQTPAAGLAEPGLALSIALIHDEAAPSDAAPGPGGWRAAMSAALPCGGQHAGASVSASGRRTRTAAQEKEQCSWSS